MQITNHTRKTRGTERCPTCGRNAQARRYKNGDIHYVHKAVVRGIFVEIVDSCYVKAGQGK